MSEQSIVSETCDNIRAGIVDLLKTARSSVVRDVNSIMTAYWEIGRRIVTLEQRGEYRTEYGEQLIERLVGDLTRQFGRGFGRANLRQMRAFYRAWPEPRIRHTLSANLITRAVSAICGRFPHLAHRSRRDFLCRGQHTFDYSLLNGRKRDPFTRPRR